jgi:DNA-binding NarL/FixJ family response regulator
MRTVTAHFDVPTDADPDDFRDYRPPAGMITRDLALIRREEKVARLRLKGLDDATIAARLKIPTAAVAAVKREGDNSYTPRIRRGS